MKVAPFRFRPLPEFTSRQHDVLRWLLEGKRDSENAVILGLSERTVEKHVHSILRTLKVESRTTAIIRILECCLASE